MCYGKNLAKEQALVRVGFGSFPFIWYVGRLEELFLLRRVAYVFIVHIMLYYELYFLF